MYSSYKTDTIEKAKKELHFLPLDIMVVLLAALCPLYYAIIGPMGVYEILGFLFIGAMFLGMLFVKPFKITIYRFQWFYLLSIIQIIIACLIKGVGWMEPVRTMVLVFIVMIIPVGEKVANKILFICSISGVATSVYLMFNGDSDVYGGRSTLIIGDVVQDPNWIALIFIIPFVYSLYMLGEKGIMKTITKILYVFVIAITGVATLMTGSRGATLGLVAGVVIWLITEKKASVKRILTLAIVAIVLIIILNGLFSEFIDENIIERLFDVEGGKDSRFEIWGRIFSEYSTGTASQIIFGFGEESCIEYVGMSGHNDLIETLFEYGIVGALLNVCFWFGFIKHLYKSENFCGFAIALVLLLESMFSPIQTIVYFTMPLAAVVCSTKPYEKEDTKEKYITISI